MVSKGERSNCHERDRDIVVIERKRKLGRSQTRCTWACITAIYAIG